MFGHLLDISTKIFIFLKIMNLEFPYLVVWFPDSKPLHREGKIYLSY